jgi:hypothetical protein
MLCGAQMLLFDHSALFSYLTLSIPWDYRLLKRLYYVGNPHDEHQISAEQGSIDYSLKLTTAIILAYADEVRRRGIDFMLIAHTGIAGLDKGALDRAAIPIADLSEFAGRTDLRWHHDGHYNPLGHRQASDAIAPMMESRLRARMAASRARP